MKTQLQTALALVPFAIGIATTSIATTCIVSLSIASSANAQSTTSDSLRPIQSPIKEAGTLHLATQTWTRGPLPAALGPDVIYNNTCGSAFFADLDHDTYVDEGRVPSPTSPGPSANMSSQPGCATSYVVNGFQIAYCTDQLSAEVRLNFYSAYAPCSALPVAATASFDLVGLPHSATLGISACWTLNVDLTTLGPSGSTFTLAADADGSYDGIPGLDSFGWSFAMPTTAITSAQGPVVAGSPATCLGFDGTAWDPTPNMSEGGTGMGTRDFFWLDSTTITSGCYYFGPAFFASFHLKLYGDTCANPGPNQIAYCFGDNRCPCSNAGAAGHGCANSVNPAGALLSGAGGASLSADTVVLSGLGMPSGSSVLYFQGNTQQNAGLGTPFGDGLRCTAGGLVRLGAKANPSGASSYPQLGDTAISTRGLVTTPGTRCYQAWYRNNASFCTSAPFNLSNGWMIQWAP